MTRPGWPQLRLRAFAAVTITSAAVISFDSIRHLATVYGFAELSWMFPLTLDAVAAFGMDLWIRESAAMRSARTLALVAIGLSLVSNVADHWLSQRSVLAALLGAVPPAMLAALLAVLHRHQVGRPGGDAYEPVGDPAWYDLTAPISALAVSPSRPRTAYDDFRDHEDRFWSKVEMGGIDDCWPWTGRASIEGYGKITIGTRDYRAHRVAWSIANNGPAPDDLMVRHLKCDNPPCCNPAHLAIGTAADNGADRSARILREKLAGSPVPVKRTAAARAPRTAGTKTVTLHTDADVLGWIKSQASVTKRSVMSRWGVGSGRALRLIKEASGG